MPALCFVACTITPDMEASLRSLAIYIHTDRLRRNPPANISDIFHRVHVIPAEDRTRLELVGD